MIEEVMGPSKRDYVFADRTSNIVWTEWMTLVLRNARCSDRQITRKVARHN